MNSIKALWFNCLHWRRTIGYGCFIFVFTKAIPEAWRSRSVSNAAHLFQVQVTEFRSESSLHNSHFHIPVSLDWKSVEKQNWKLSHLLSSMSSNGSSHSNGTVDDRTLLLFIFPLLVVTAPRANDVELISTSYLKSHRIAASTLCKVESFYFSVHDFKCTTAYKESKCDHRASNGETPHDHLSSETTTQRIYNLWAKKKYYHCQEENFKTRRSSLDI